MTPFACIQVSTPRSIVAPELGRAILESFAVAPSLMPERYSNFEPIRQPFDFSDLETVLQNWTWPFLWKRSKPRSSGGAWIAHPNNPRHSTLVLEVRDYKRVPAIELLALMARWSEVSEADFGLVHLFTDSDVERSGATDALSRLDREGKRHSFMIPSQQLQKYIPDLYWFTLFGCPYIQMFGRDCLLSAPAHRVEETRSGQVTVQLTENLFDLETDPGRVALVRDRVIDHLGADAFFFPECPLYRTPKFSFHEPG